MMSRSLEPRTRLLALETVAQVRGWCRGGSCFAASRAYLCALPRSPSSFTLRSHHADSSAVCLPACLPACSWRAGCPRSTSRCCPRRSPSWQSCWRTLSWRWRLRRSASCASSRRSAASRWSSTCAELASVPVAPPRGVINECFFHSFCILLRDNKWICQHATGSGKGKKTNARIAEIGME